MKMLTGLMFVALPLAAFGAEIRFTGSAKPVEGGDTLYQEVHTVSGLCQDGLFKSQNHTVDYRREGSGTFATKELSYRESVLRPTISFNQPEFSETMRIQNEADNLLKISWQTPQGKKKAFTVDVNPSLVADAGFDNFVRQNWATVVGKGQSVDFDILAPTRGDYYGFTLEPSDDRRIQAEHQVKIGPSGTLMGFLVDPILLGYNADGLLTDYVGLTNIRKDEDSNYVAHIRYRIEATPECPLTR